jgi:hypothetical protein
MDLVVWRRRTMRLNCPGCGYKFRFLDLYLFKLKDYQIKCRKCDRVFKLDGHIDQFGIIYFALLAMILLVLIGVFFKVLSNHFIFSPFVKKVIIAFIIIFISLFVIYGHPVYLVWNIRRKYRKGQGSSPAQAENNK